MEFDEFVIKTNKFMSEKSQQVLWKKLKGEELTKKEKRYMVNYVTPRIRDMIELNKILEEMKNGKE